jgi:hypothetical protein
MHVEGPPCFYPVSIYIYICIHRIYTLFLLTQSPVRKSCQSSLTALEDWHEHSSRSTLRQTNRASCRKALTGHTTLADLEGGSIDVLIPFLRRHVPLKGL